LSGNGIVDWGLAERVAVRLAGEPRLTESAAAEFAPGRVSAACEEAREHVAAYTGLVPRSPLPAGEAVRRSEWARSALRSLREMSGPIEDRLASGLSLPGPLGSISRGLAGAAAGAEAGGAVGMGARRVLGQLEVSLGDVEREPRLLLVAPNLAEARASIGGDPDAFLRWIASHEVTHAVQFTAVPWLRDHLRGELRALLDSAAEGLDRGDLGAMARKLVTTDPRRTVRGLLRGELATALAGPGQRARLERLQAVMSVIEGYAEHVMDAADPGRRAERLELRARLEKRRRSRGGLGEVVMRLLGLELKMRQYRLGKAFCDAVVAEGGIESLNGVWESPDSLPASEELSDPARWLARAGRAPSSAHAGA
jgi:coenzyme F420 biosynthesis associated uncharacterized protein